MFKAIDRLAACADLVALGRRDPDGRRRRYWSISPHGIYYRVDHGVLWVLEIKDSAGGAAPGRRSPGTRSATWS